MSYPKEASVADEGLSDGVRAAITMARQLHMSKKSSGVGSDELLYATTKYGYVLQDEIACKLLLQLQKHGFTAECCVEHASRSWHANAEFGDFSFGFAQIMQDARELAGAGNLVEPRHVLIAVCAKNRRGLQSGQILSRCVAEETIDSLYDEYTKLLIENGGEEKAMSTEEFCVVTDFDQVAGQLLLNLADNNGYSKPSFTAKECYAICFAPDKRLVTFFSTKKGFEASYGRPVVSEWLDIVRRITQKGFELVVGEHTLTVDRNGTVGDLKYSFSLDAKAIELLHETAKLWSRVKVPYQLAFHEDGGVHIGCLRLTSQNVNQLASMVKSRLLLRR